MEVPALRQAYPEETSAHDDPSTRLGTAAGTALSGVPGTGGGAEQCRYADRRERLAGLFA
jgi:hypothetical protein